MTGRPFTNIKVGGSPPITTRGRRKGFGKYQPVLDKAREVAPQWVHVQTTSSITSIQSLVKRGRYGDAKPGEFDAKIINVGKPNQQFWVRVNPNF